MMLQLGVFVMLLSLSMVISSAQGLTKFCVGCGTGLHCRVHFAKCHGVFVSARAKRSGHRATSKQVSVHTAGMHPRADGPGSQQ